MKWFSRLFRTNRPFKLTPAGWVFILYTIGVGAGAINTGNNLLYIVFGVFLGLLLASGLLSDLSLWSVEVECIPPDFARAGEVVALPIRLHNQKKKFSSFSVHVELDGRLGQKRIQLKTHVPFAEPQETVPAHFEFTPVRRGYFSFEEFRLTTQYPFGLLKKWWMVRSPVFNEGGLYVYPRIFPLDARSLALLHAGDNDRAVVSERGFGTLVQGVREFQSSDNPRHIHWKASAKQNRGSSTEMPSWLVREMEKEHTPDVVVFLPSPSETKSLSMVKVEWMISLAASVLEECRQSGRRGRLVLKGEDTPSFQEVDSDGNAEAPSQFLSLWDPTVVPTGRMASALKAVDPAELSNQISLSVIDMFDAEGEAA